MSIELTTATDQQKIAICSALGVDRSVDYGAIAFLSPNGSDVSGVVGNPLKPFALAQAAYDAGARVLVLLPRASSTYGALTCGIGGSGLTVSVIGFCKNRCQLSSVTICGADTVIRGNGIGMVHLGSVFLNGSNPVVEDATIALLQGTVDVTAACYVRRCVAEGDVTLSGADGNPSTISAVSLYAEGCSYADIYANGAVPSQSEPGQAGAGGGAGGQIHLVACKFGTIYAIGGTGGQGGNALDEYSTGYDGGVGGNAGVIKLKDSYSVAEVGYLRVVGGDGGSGGSGSSSGMQGNGGAGGQVYLVRSGGPLYAIGAGGSGYTPGSGGSLEAIFSELGHESFGTASIHASLANGSWVD